MKQVFAVFLGTVLLSCSKHEDVQPNSSGTKDPPSITLIDPLAGTPGTLITITGSGFSSNIADNVVKFNGVTASVTQANSSTLTAKVPVSAGTGIVSVATSNGIANGSSFSYIPDVIVAGSEAMHGAGNFYIAKYWINGVAYSVTDGTMDGIVNSMFVSGTDIYLSGYQESTDGVTHAWYSKNGVVRWLTAGNVRSVAYSIDVSGGDAYVCGWVFDGKHYVARYWKNGVSNSLTDETANSNAYSIKISGNDVYVAGDEFSSAAPFPVAKYWKNGSPSSLSDGSSFASANSLMIYENDVYVSGYVFDGQLQTFRYWKNGTETKISDGAPTWINQIFCSANSVLLAGNEDRIAAYWKNGVSVPLTNGNDLAQAHGMTVYENDIYVVGNEQHLGLYQSGKYWKNGAETVINDPSKSTVFLQAITVR